MCWKAETLLCWKRSVCQGYGLPSGHIQLWELDHKEGRGPKNWCLWTVMVEKTPESPLDSKIKPISFKGNRLNTHWKDWCWCWSSSVLVIWCEQSTLWKSPWCWERLREKEEGIIGKGGGMASLMQCIWTPGDGEGQGLLVCCSPQGYKELDTTGQLNNMNDKQLINI